MHRAARVRGGLEIRICQSPQSMGLQQCLSSGNILEHCGLRSCLVLIIAVLCFILTLAYNLGRTLHLAPDISC